MKSCISFFYKTILNKKSVYLFSIILVFMLLLVTYILPYALKININQLLQMSIVMVLVVLLIAIYGIIVSTVIFRQGIDDGSEILIITKCVTRKQIVLSKLIVLLSLIFFISLIAFIIPIFLIFSNYGTSYPWDYSVGFFLVTLIVSTLFSGISVLFSIIMKKSHATLLGLGIAFLLTLINIINFMLVNNPGFYNQKYGYSIQNVTYYDSNNNPINGVILNQYYVPYNTSIKDNVIQKIQNEANNYTKTNLYTYFDPFFQFSTLFSLGNFYKSNNNFTGKNINNPNSIFNNSTWSNIYIAFNQINNFELNKKFKIKIDDQFIEYTYLFNNNLEIINDIRNFKFTINQEIINSNNCFVLPILNFNDNGCTDNLTLTNNLTLKVFNIDNETSMCSLINELFSNDKNSIYTLYNNYLKWISNTHNNNIIRYFNFNSFLNTYLFLGYSLLFENIIKEDPIKCIIDNSSSFFIPKLFLLYLLSSLGFDSNNLSNYFNIKNSNELLNVKYIKPSIIFLFLVRLNIYNFQKCLLNINYSLPKNIDSELIVNILNLFQYNSSQYSNFVVLMNKNIVNKNLNYISQYNSSYNPGDISNLLNSLNVSKIKYSSNPYQFVRTDTLNTFSTFEYKYYINIYGLIFGWFIFSSLLLLIATWIYAKKDIK